MPLSSFKLIKNVLLSDIGTVSFAVRLRTNISKSFPFKISFASSKLIFDRRLTSISEPGRARISDWFAFEFLGQAPRIVWIIYFNDKVTN